jgi:hypothetical protein
VSNRSLMLTTTEKASGWKRINGSLSKPKIIIIIIIIKLPQVNFQR